MMRKIKSKYNHVGRPSNEEVKIYGNKKKIKIIAVIFLMLVAFGSIYIYLNRDNVNFLLLMGNSSSESIKKFKIIRIIN